jgi:hypothetical protein
MHGERLFNSALYCRWLELLHMSDRYILMKGDALVSCEGECDWTGKDIRDDVAFGSIACIHPFLLFYQSLQDTVAL